MLIFEGTDVCLDLGGGVLHLTGRMDTAEADKAEERASAFASEDIPALTEGAMVPDLEVLRPPGPLTRLSASEHGWWPSPSDVSDFVTPGFDSVIVIWEPRVSDNAGQTHRLAGAGGLAARDRGVGQTYAALPIEEAALVDHRNTFKHEFGHSILCYFRALGVPVPEGDNHADEGDFVHFGGGPPYDWRDETLSSPIPNSVYSNEAGFTHDYYAGQLAAASDPTVRLGITPDDWARGGPVAPGIT